MSDVTLQLCIDDAAPGDGIGIGTDTPIDERVTVGKSLNIEAYGGHHPTISQGMVISASS